MGLHPLGVSIGKAWGVSEIYVRGLGA